MNLQHIFGTCINANIIVVINSNSFMLKPEFYFCSQSSINSSNYIFLPLQAGIREVQDVSPELKRSISGNLVPNEYEESELVSMDDEPEHRVKCHVVIGIAGVT